MAENINALHDSIEVLTLQLISLKGEQLHIEDEQGRLANCIRELKLKVK